MSVRSVSDPADPSVWWDTARAMLSRDEIKTRQRRVVRSTRRVVKMSHCQHQLATLSESRPLASRRAAEVGRRSGVALSLSPAAGGGAGARGRGVADEEHPRRACHCLPGTVPRPTDGPGGVHGERTGCCSPGPRTPAGRVRQVAGRTLGVCAAVPRVAASAADATLGSGSRQVGEMAITDDHVDR